MPIDHRSKRPSTGYIRRAMKPTFLAVFPFSVFCFLSLFLFRFGCCFVSSRFRFFVCLFAFFTSCCSGPQSPTIIESSRRWQDWHLAGRSLCTEYRKQDLYSVLVPNTSRSFLSRPLSRVVKRRSIDREQPFVPLINSAVSCVSPLSNMINADNIFSNQKTLCGSYRISALCFPSFHWLASEVTARWFEQHIYLKKKWYWNQIAGHWVGRA